MSEFVFYFDVSLMKTFFVSSEKVAKDICKMAMYEIEDWPRTYSIEYDMDYRGRWEIYMHGDARPCHDIEEEKAFNEFKRRIDEFKIFVMKVEELIKKTEEEG